jgi:hypothetical protein
MQFFTENEKKISKFIWKHKIIRIANVIVNNKNAARCITIRDFQVIVQSYSSKNIVLLGYKQGWRSISVVKIKYCSCIGLKFDSQYLF